MSTTRFVSFSLHSLFIAAGVMFALNASAATVQTLNEGVLTIGSDLTWAPFDYLDKGVPAGFDAELMEKISKGLGLTPKIEDTRFTNLVTGLTSQKIDIIASALYITPARAKQIDYVPYLKTGGALMTLKGNDFQPLLPEDLCGKRVASLKGAAWVPSLNKLSTEHCQAKGLGAITLQEYASSPVAAQALLSRAADVQFDDAAVAQMMVKQTNGRLQITSRQLLEPVVIGMGIKKGNTSLTQAIQQQLDQLKKTGEYQALLEKYNLEEPSAEEIAAAYAVK